MPAPDVGFVACIEGGVLERQALLLFDSIRRWTGRFKDCPIYAFSPRADHAISSAGRARLDALAVHYDDRIINTGCVEYGPANRVAAGAYIEDRCAHEALIVLDSDTLFLREPTALELPADVDFLARPVDHRNASTTGDGHPLDRYWRELCARAGLDYDALPWTRSFVDDARIKADYNGGLCVTRPARGVLRRCADLLFDSVRDGVFPREDSVEFRAGVGWVGPMGRRLWGSSQIALAIAAWSATSRVRELPATYNYPLHLHGHLDAPRAEAAFPHLVHVHYHWLFEPDALAENPLFHPFGPLRPEQREWLRAALPLRASDESSAA